MMIDAGEEGAFYVGALVRGARWIPARDIAVMRSLSRHLAPLARQLLAHDRVLAEARRHLALTPREREVADLAARGLTNQQIAARLFVGVTTVKKHLGRVLAKTGATSRTQLAVRWSEFHTGTASRPIPARERSPAIDTGHEERSK
ncbi:LuxR C-terminal-related transcriptional regulator [Streptomyces profundus]|nr:LuxR C-terminal-related transcriptional regulator [Streptomyces sp. MA3_2.13]